MFLPDVTKLLSDYTVSHPTVTAVMTTNLLLRLHKKHQPVKTVQEGKRCLL
jgi:hypothetical protein